jgi:O-antigen/teichoic acid export membrane protein
MNLKKNVIANYLGQGWTVLMGLAFIPLYIKYLGMEAYGLIGVFAVLQAWLTLLDMGMTPTLNREMARYKAGALSKESIFDLLRSIEWICAGLTLLIIICICFFAPLLSEKWFNFEKLPVETVTKAIITMGFVIATRLWEEIYRSAIRGMQQQVWLNIAQGILATLRWAGVLVVLLWVSTTIQAFFLWQGFISVVSVFVYAYKTYHSLPDSSRGGKFSLESIRNVRRFAGGIAIITVLALLLTQVDKVLLSGLLTLEDFGYYMLAALIAGGLAQLIPPMNAAIYPKFTELLACHDDAALVNTYHGACQLLSAVIIPPALVLSAFSEQIILLWTGDPVLTSAAAPIMRVLVIGTLLNGLMNVPYMLQLAYGWTGFAVRVNIVAVIFVIPAILWVVPRYGVMGAAWIWLLLNVSYVFVGLHFMFQKLIPKEKWRWFKESIAKPFIVAVTVAFGLAFFIPVTDNSLVLLLNILVASICVELAVVLVLPSVRQRIKSVSTLLLR